MRIALLALLILAGPVWAGGCSSGNPPAATAAAGPGAAGTPSLHMATIPGTFATAEEAALATLTVPGESWGDEDGEVDRPEALRMLAAPSAQNTAGPLSYRDDDGGAAILFNLSSVPFKDLTVTTTGLRGWCDWFAVRLWPRVRVENFGGSGGHPWALVGQEPDGRWRVVDRFGTNCPWPVPSSQNGWHDVTKGCRAYGVGCTLNFCRFDGTTYQCEWTATVTDRGGWVAVPIPKDLVRERLAAKLGAAREGAEGQGGFAFQTDAENDGRPPQLLLGIARAVIGDQAIDLATFGPQPTNLFLYTRDGDGWRLIFEGLSRGLTVDFPYRDEATGDLIVPVQTGGEGEHPEFGKSRLRGDRVVESPWEE
jgi:hypothetical protein